ncbi:hypothetical protein StoSoilA2_10360 [Arthrobacter sp. StoSoilA2]|nr:hypothetical protein StoSoilA2_10360 [Arthrobacter sp. StoSoilA2]
MKIKAGPLDGANPNLHHGRDVAVFQSPHVPDLVLHNQRHGALLNIIEEGRRWFNARKASAPWWSESRDSGFFQHPNDLHIVDVPVGIHVTPAHGYEYLDALGFHGIPGVQSGTQGIRAQLCTAVESSTAVSSSPANWDMYRR